MKTAYPTRRLKGVMVLFGLFVSLFVSSFAAAAPVLEEDVPEIADPSWATGIRNQLDNDKYDEALAALQKLAPKYGKAFQFHTLTAEAYEGKSFDSDIEKDEIRWLKKARESYLKAEALAPAKQKPIVRALRELVEADLKDLGAPVKPAPKASQTKPAPSKAPAKPAKPSPAKKALNGVTLTAKSVKA